MLIIKYHFINLEKKLRDCILEGGLLGKRFIHCYNSRFYEVLDIGERLGSIPGLHVYLNVKYDENECSTLYLRDCLDDLMVDENFDALDC